jgi:uncharacterized protein
MKPRITLITIGVDDLEASLKFYRDGLGLPTKGIVGQEYEHGAVVFIDLQRGLRLALFPRRNIAHDAGLPVSPRSPTEFTLAHNVVSENEVDDVMAQAVAAGAKLVKKAQKAFWGGYIGIFQDPDGHLWEVAYNPEMIPTDS